MVDRGNSSLAETVNMNKKEREDLLSQYFDSKRSMGKKSPSLRSQLI